MYYTQVDLKLTRAIPIQLGDEEPRIVHEYHEVANRLFDKWDRKRFVYLARKTLRRGEFTFYAASNQLEDPVSYVKEFVDQLGRDIREISITEITEETFLEGFAYARHMGYLRNGKEICIQLEI